MSNLKPVLGIIGGSGLYEIDGLKNKEWKKVQSSFGEPSDELLFGELNDQKMVFLPRHGRGHKIPPSEINYRANIDALKRAGVTEIISVSAVGSLKENLKPGMFVIVDQFIDRTFARSKSFFSSGLVAHVSMANPVCNRLGSHLKNVAQSLGIEVTRGGTYIAMEGPQFSSKAESELYRSWGCDVVGMTNMPEAKLAREAEIRYASVSMVTDYDCWHPDHENVDVQQVVRVLLSNVEKAKVMIKNLIDNFEDYIDLKDPTNNCLDLAIITAPEKQTKQTKNKLKNIAGRVLSK